MRRSDKFMLILLAAVMILLAGGIIQLFSLRFRQGDIYPPYSSLRADPLGTKAIYESLEAMGGIRVDRNVRRFDKFEGSPNTSLIFIGLNADQDEIAENGILEQIGSVAVGGTRVILGFTPAVTTKHFERWLPLPTPPPAPARARKGTANPNDPFASFSNWRDLLQEWDARMEFRKPEVDRSSRKIRPFNATRTEDFKDSGLPESIPVRTGIYFLPSDASPWKIVYQIEDRPVILERKYGDGSIVLMAEGYPLSNEAINADRQTALIGWLLGDASAITFDETHLGIEQTPGLMNLARKYGLQAAFAALGLLAMLFIWNAVTPIVPRRSEEEEVEHIARGQNRDAFAGMVNLLRRSIPPQDLMEVCLEQWKRTLRGSRPGLLARIQQADAAARIAKDAGRLRSAPAESYREIFDILNRRGGNP